MSEAKSQIRKSLLTKRKALPKARAASLGVLAQTALINSELWQKAQTVALYLSLPSETATDMLLEYAFADGKIIYAPKLQAQQMSFARFSGMRDLTAGPHGIRQPACNDFAANVDLLLVPGIGFDRHGYRIGYGGGYYDRFLAQNPDFAKTAAGFCFGFQIVQKLPEDTWDIPVQALCSEDGWQWL